MASRRARVAIGVPVYNGARFLGSTVESLLAQTFDDFELLISDNASTDATEDVARDLAARDPRVRYHRHPTNRGLAANYNFLFEQASSAYFKWGTADDVCAPTFLERCVAALDADPGVVLAAPRAAFIDAEGRPLAVRDPGFPLDAGSASARLRYVFDAGSWVNAILGVIRADALARTPLMPRYAGGDYVLLGELAARGRFVEIPEALLQRRVHAEASSQLVDDPERILRLVTGRGGVSLPRWFRLRDHARTVLGSALPRREKLALLAQLARRARWDRGRLGRELWLAGRVALQSLRRREAP